MNPLELAATADDFGFQDARLLANQLPVLGLIAIWQPSWIVTHRHVPNVDSREVIENYRTHMARNGARNVARNY